MLDCRCGAGPFDSPEALEEHGREWHADGGRVEADPSVLEGLTVRGVEVVEAGSGGGVGYVVVRLDDDVTLYADAPSVYAPAGSPRAQLIVSFEVGGLSEAEREQLAGEVAAQAERSDGHPSVEFEMTWEVD